MVEFGIVNLCDMVEFDTENLFGGGIARIDLRLFGIGRERA